MSKTLFPNKVTLTDIGVRTSVYLLEDTVQCITMPELVNFTLLGAGISLFVVAFL